MFLDGNNHTTKRLLISVYLSNETEIVKLIGGMSFGLKKLIRDNKVSWTTFFVFKYKYLLMKLEDSLVTSLNFL